jgi:hypothetical protein
MMSFLRTICIDETHNNYLYYLQLLFHPHVLRLMLNLPSRLVFQRNTRMLALVSGYSNDS